MTSPDAGYAVRLANAGDIAAVAGARARWREHEADDTYIGEFERWWRETDGRRRTWVAVAADRVIGMVSMTVFTRMPSPGEPAKQWAYVGQVWVDPAYRRLGIARTMMTEAIAWARHALMERIVLNPSEMSRPLYAGLGFRSAADLLRLDLDGAS